MTTEAEAPSRSALQAQDSSLASSATFGTFAIVFAIATPILYVLSEVLSLPLFTYHPGTNRVEFGWTPPRLNEGPAMYWYGWTVTSLIGGAALGLLATLLPQNLTKKIPLSLVWLVPFPVLAILAYVLMPFWTK